MICIFLHFHYNRTFFSYLWKDERPKKKHYFVFNIDGGCEKIKKTGSYYLSYINSIKRKQSRKLFILLLLINKIDLKLHQLCRGKLKRAYWLVINPANGLIDHVTIPRDDNNFHRLMIHGW